jgi:hypothetical protein
MPRKKSKAMVTSGIFIPFQKDATGKVVLFSIRSSNQGEYILERRKTNSNIDSLLYKNVKVVGRIRECLDGKKTVSVRELHLLEEKTRSVQENT